MYKQVFIFLSSIKLLKVERAEICCQNSIKLIYSIEMDKSKAIKGWFLYGQKKICAQIPTLEELKELELKLKYYKIPFLEICNEIIRSHENSKGSKILGLVIGPELSKKLDKITGHLKLN